MMEQLLRSGPGWRIGWNPLADSFQGLVGSDDWSLELTAAELSDFCRLAPQLARTIAAMQSSLMDEEAIVCEAESPLIWLEADGLPNLYSLHLIVLTGRRGEGYWKAAAVPALLAAMQSLSIGAS